MLKVLIIDDDSKKIDSIIQEIEKVNKEDVECDYKLDIHQGEMCLSTIQYDLVILDIELPRKLGNGEKMVNSGGLELLEVIENMNTVKKPTAILGMTMHDQLFDDLQREFTDHMWTLIKYNIAETRWRELLKAKVEYLLEWKSSYIKSMAQWQEEESIMKNKEEKKKIFLGSSKEAQESMIEVGIIIEELGHVPITWTDPKIFIPTDFAYESLFKVLEEVDGAIFIFNKDDTVWYREKEFNKVRDNVLLEYGMFAGKLGRNKVTMACKDNPDIATDLMGVNYIDLEKMMSAKKKIEIWLNQF